MPRGIPGSGPKAGRGNSSKGRKTKAHTLADIAARSGNAQTASAAPAAPAVAPPPPAAVTTGHGRGRGRASTPKPNARKANGTGQRAGKANAKTTGQQANNGQQRAGDQPAATGGDGGTEVVTNGVKIEIVAVPGRGGRPQQSEAFPFAQLEPTKKGAGGELIGPSFLIPEEANPDNVLAAARKRHKGKTFTARKMEGGVRIWRLT